MRNLALLCLLAAAPHAALAAPPDPELDRAPLQELAAQKLAGLALGVVEDGKVTYLQGYGYEDAEAKVPVDPRATLFRWASISKTVTAAAALRAASRGRLDLDADVRGLAAGWAPPASYMVRDSSGAAALLPLPSTAAVTVRMLLAHTAGIPHYDNGARAVADPPEALTADRASNAGFAWALRYWAGEPLVSYPGREHHYSSFGYNLAGAALEKAAGRPFWELVHDDLSAPLGMATFQPDYQWRKIPRRAVGYAAVSSGTFVRDGDSDVNWKLPAGGFLSSAEDMAKWCAGLMGDAVLSEDLKRQAWASHPDAAGSDPEYGLGFMTGKLERRRWVGHSGSQQKTVTWLMLVPDERLCAVALTNSAYGNPRPVVEGVLRALLSRRRR